MKKISTLALLAAVLLLSESFTGNSAAKTSARKNFPSFALTVDAAPFEVKALNNYSAQLINNSRTASITFSGNDVRDNAGHVYPTKIQIDYTMRDAALGDVNVEKVTYEYNNQKYNFVPGTGFVSITKMKWAADRKSFVMSADIFCKVQKSYVMEEFVPVLVIRGSVQNLTVTEPIS